MKKKKRERMLSMIPFFLETQKKRIRHRTYCDRRNEKERSEEEEVREMKARTLVITNI